MAERDRMLALESSKVLVAYAQENVSKGLKELDFQEKQVKQARSLLKNLEKRLVDHKARVRNDQKMLKEAQAKVKEIVVLLHMTEVDKRTNAGIDDNSDTRTNSISKKNNSDTPSTTSFEDSDAASLESINNSENGDTLNNANVNGNIVTVSSEEEESASTFLFYEIFVEGCRVLGVKGSFKPLEIKPDGSQVYSKRGVYLGEEVEFTLTHARGSCGWWWNIVVTLQCGTCESLYGTHQLKRLKKELPQIDGWRKMPSHHGTGPFPKLIGRTMSH